MAKDSRSSDQTKQYQKVPVPNYPKKINIGVQEDFCNLACPKCLVFGTNKDADFDVKKIVTSTMTMGRVIDILDEVQGQSLSICPTYWVEPLVVKNFKNIAIEAKKRNIPVVINSNGLLINESMAEFLVEHMTAISISIDATTKETLIKTRATDRLERIHNAVFLLLEKRGGKDTPRVMVNMTVEEANRSERDEFLEYWIQHVDAVRINEMYTYERSVDGMSITRQRTPCRGVYNVWHGDGFTEAREAHEKGNYSALPFCDTCNLWAGYNITDERTEGNLLIRSSDSINYYNRLDRMASWKDDFKRNDLEFLPQ